MYCDSERGFYSRWAALAASFIVNAFNLFSYAFGLFSDTLKSDLGFSQRSIDFIASVGELGLWSSFFVGLMLERMTPRQVYIVGSGATLVGLGYVALATDKARHVLSSNPTSFGMMFFLANFGTACFSQSAQAIAVQNFPAKDRGKVSGIIKSIFGLSSAVLGVLYIGLFGGTGVAKFLEILSVGVPLLGVISMIPLNVVPQKHLSYMLEISQGVSPVLVPFYIWFAVLTFFLSAATVLKGIGVSLPTPWTGFAVLFVVGFSSILPLFYGRVFFRVATLEHDAWHSDGQVGGSSEDSRLLGESNGHFELEGDTTVGEESLPLLGGALEEVGDNQGPYAILKTNHNLTWKQCLRDKRFWVLYIGFLCGAGSGLVVINNVASLVDSLGLESSSLLVTMLGIASAIGRISSGWISDQVVGMGFPRALVLCATLLTTCLVDLLLAAGFTQLLYFLCVATGFCYGSMFSLVLALTGDMFGVEHIGTNYGLLDLGPAAGSFIFATGIVNIFYQNAPNGDDCMGAHCFRGTFFVTAGSCLIACILVYTTVVRPGLRACQVRGRGGGHDS
ncbi:unnamed protein product [Choristocarpus tenellus]